MKKAICIAGAVCGPPIWRRPTWTRPVRILRPAGGLGAGLVGIGTRGSTPILLCREMASGIARSAGGSILLGGSLTLRSSGMVWGMVTATAVGATSITSVITVIGNPILPTWH